VKYYKHQHGYCDNSEHNRADNDGDGRINLTPILHDYEYNHVDDSCAKRAHNSHNEENKESIVTFSNAITNKGTVVIEYLDAVVASGAVAGPGRTKDVASGTVITILLHIVP
jgi:hypothetical protein